MSKIPLLKAIIYSRVLHLFYHYCHLLTYGETFVGDHSLFGGFYEEMSDHYDRLSEYLIATLGNEAFETQKINMLVAEELQRFKIEKISTISMLAGALILEKEFYTSLQELDSVATIGLKNMIGDLAEKSDSRQYKILQRKKLG